VVPAFFGFLCASRGAKPRSGDGALSLSSVY
jgi:hypothetical protein